MVCFEFENMMVSNSNTFFGYVFSVIVFFGHCFFVEFCFF